MAKEKSKTLKDISFDPTNFNKGTEQGDFLLTKSLQEFGFREAATVDKNGVLIGGNKRTAKAGELGFEELEIIKADPKKVYALQYDDIDMNTDHGKRLALALNQTASKNILIDAEVVTCELGEAVLVEWGGSNENFSDKNKEIDTDFDGQQYTFKLEFSEEEYTLLKEKLEAQGKTPEQIFYNALISL